MKLSEARRVAATLRATMHIASNDARALDILLQETEGPYGFKNKETAMCELMLDQNQWSNDRRRQILEEVMASPNDSEVFTLEEFIRFEFAKRLQEWVEGLFEDVWSYAQSAGGRPQHCKDIVLLMQDVGSLWRVDWEELADHWISEAKEG